MVKGEVRSAPTGGDAEVVITNGDVLALHELGRHATTVAIRGDRIVAVGDHEDLVTLVGQRTTVIDAAGGCVLPGFTDSHTHFKRASMLLAHYLDFAQARPESVREVLALIERRVAERDDGQWIQGDSLNPLSLTDGRFPHRDEIDTVAPRNPVVIRGVGRHVVAANSRALEMAGIDHDTADPPGGRIERDPAGQPIGILHERAQLRLDANAEDTVIPRPTIKDRLQALQDGVTLLNSLGIVAVHEMAREPDQIGDWLMLRETMEPRLRVRFYARALEGRTKLEHVLGLGLRGEFGDDWCRLGGIKISVDGSDLFRNAMVYEPYLNDPSNAGLQRVDTAEFFEAVRLAHASRLQIAVHAIGQRAVDLTLEAFASLDDGGESLATRRHRIEHAFLPPRPGQLERIRDLGLVYSTQPSFIEANGDAWLEIFGERNLDGVMPLARAVELGMMIQFNSDFPCSELSPFVGIKAAVNRRTRGGHVLDSRQAISVAAALRAMTEGAAYTAFEEDRRGRLAPGQLADVIVVDRNPLRIATDELDTIEVTKTLVGGRLVHQQ